MTARNTAENFWARVDKSGGPDACWPWTGNVNPDGYGSVRWHGVLTKTHRTAYVLTTGPITSGLCVCHHCDNPPCCNPAHLWLGTPGENAADREAKGRGHRRTGELNPRAKLSAQDVQQIREARASGTPRRVIAKRFGVSGRTIYDIVIGRTWYDFEVMA